MNDEVRFDFFGGRSLTVPRWSVYVDEDGVLILLEDSLARYYTGEIESVTFLKK